MDGLNPAILFTNNLDHIEFLTVDIRENKLYWAVTSTGMVGLLSQFHLFILCGSKIITDIMLRFVTLYLSHIYLPGV